jgi:peptidoglycan/xylan/chitin deacetylase (PgdA/CDA1 family)
MSRISGKTVETLDFRRMEALRTTGHPKVCITFDDAFANLLDNALPALKRYRIPAIVFAVADNLGEIPNWHMPQGHSESNEMVMTAEQLAAISKNSLVKIGSHTMTHPDLVKIRSEQIRTELVESKVKLESLLDICIEDLALPHGSYNEEVLTLAQEMGYKRIYTLDPQATDFEDGNPIVGRFSMSPDAWNVEFMLTCAGAYAWLYPWRRFVRRLKGRIH